MYRFPHQNFIFSRDFPASHVYQRVNMFPSGQKLDPWAAAITSWRVVAPAMLLIDNPHQYRYIYHKPEIGVIKHLREFVAANWCCEPRVSKSFCSRTGSFFLQRIGGERNRSCEEDEGLVGQAARVHCSSKSVEMVWVSCQLRKNGPEKSYKSWMVWMGYPARNQRISTYVYRLSAKDFARFDTQTTQIPHDWWEGRYQYFHEDICWGYRKFDPEP